ncbi:molybdopterin molybdotransferase MoeA [Ghiorsea bivora]|uniref:molybdopterin molybdotransferase MoeA n=1 Tax=Ghiorsea bivora TaxID=1485545 RepID=UPI000571AE1E|nr:gephyrin-like molybdotransferase Glp [Ghiorsea bivora]
MNYLSVGDALAEVLKHISRKAVEHVALYDSLRRVLAEDVAANRNHPPYDVSAMDGYAVRFADIETVSAENPVRLKVVDDIRAGQMPSIKVLQGRAARIMTGAPTPEGVDTVIRVEDTQEDGHDVLILTPPKQGANIRPMGENLKNEKTVLSKGTSITPGVLAILSMVKQKQVPVFAKPSVAILSTGDELEALDEPVDENKIPDANSHALYAQCKALGIEATLLGIAKDNPLQLRAKLEEGLKYDVLLASGGVSVGHHDFVRSTLDALGITMHFWRVAMRPGHPLAFGTTKQGGVVFGLPGNPVSSMVCFEEFVSPALRSMMGYEKICRRTITAKLSHDLKDRKGRAHFVRVTLSKDEQGYLATSTGTQGSGVLMSMAIAQGFVVVPEESEGLKAGDKVQVQLLQDMDFQEELGI